MGKKSLNFEDILDLSVIDLYILYFLIRIAGKTLRFDVFNEINETLPSNKISRSSFYNSLKKLENKHLVIIEDNPHARGKLVSSTELAKQAIQQSNMFSIWGTVDEVSSVSKIMSNLTSSADRGLLIYLDDILNHTLILENLTPAKKAYMLVEEDEIDSIVPFREQYDYSLLKDSQVKEMNEFFDQVIVYKYQDGLNLGGMDSDALLTEIRRLLGKGGKLLLIGFKEVPRTDNILVSSFIEDLLTKQIIAPVDQKSVRNILEAKNFKVEEVVDSGYFQGIFATKIE